MTKGLKSITAICGLLSVSVFVFSFVLFGFLHTDFDFVRDFISKLGGKGQPNAFYWNAFGFTAVGILLGAFGGCFGLRGRTSIVCGGVGCFWGWGWLCSLSLLISLHNHLITPITSLLFFCLPRCLAAAAAARGGSRSE